MERHLRADSGKSMVPKKGDRIDKESVEDAFLRLRPDHPDLVKQAASGGFEMGKFGEIDFVFSETPAHREFWRYLGPTVHAVLKHRLVDATALPRWMNQAKHFDGTPLVKCEEGLVDTMALIAYPRHPEVGFEGVTVDHLKYVVANYRDFLSEQKVDEVKPHWQRQC